jgi:hypothetical protein
VTSRPRIPFDALTLALAGASVLWLVVALMPAGLPAWPSVSLGVLALLAARAPGRALPRGAGAFLGLAGIVGGAVQIGAVWGLASVLT